LPLRTKANLAGTKLNPDIQLGVLIYGSVVGTKLEKYIDVDRFKNSYELHAPDIYLEQYVFGSNRILRSNINMYCHS